MKKVAVLQSNYLPWKGYFDLIHDVDVFLFYDQVQFTKSDWRNRNRVKTAAGVKWLTVPVGSHIHRRIDQVEIHDKVWAAKHWKSLQQSYSKAPHFHRYQDYLRWFYLDNQWSSLSFMNQQLTQHVARDWLGISTEFAQAPKFGDELRRQDRLLAVLHSVGAGLYVSGPAAKAYLETDRFSAASIDVLWKDYSGYPVYDQFYPPFEHAVTILDLLFHVGPDAPWYVWGWRDEARATARA